ncbi:MAG: hypothetical protein WC356_01185 [Candidatus Micrarchaeia archaeon]|jgi:oligoribonuclease NrnB/cAMP/cGMP phosphodiesterase (DHH superfamily)
MRLLTHRDFDGVVCAVLLKDVEDIDKIVFTTPNSVIRNKVFVTKYDVISDLPYHKKCGMWFDHHTTNRISLKFEGSFALEKSCAQVIYNYYENPYLDKYRELIEITNKIDSAEYEIEDVLEPKGYILIAFSSIVYDKPWETDKYLLKMVNWLSFKKPEEILEIPEVKDNAEIILKDIEFYKDIIEAWSEVEDNKFFVLDMRGGRQAPKIGKFLVHALHSKIPFGIIIYQSQKNPNLIKINVSYNMFRKDVDTDFNAGAYAEQYGGGGHKRVGVFTVKGEEKAQNLIEKTKEVLREIKLNQ